MVIGLVGWLKGAYIIISLAYIIIKLVIVQNRTKWWKGTIQTKLLRRKRKCSRNTSQTQYFGHKSDTTGLQRLHGEFCL